MESLAGFHCVPCRGGEPPLEQAEIRRYQEQTPEWSVVEEDGVARLRRGFRFRNFAQALEFTRSVGALAEQEGHHPVLVTEWGRTTVSWWTHKIGGLHRNDFIMAARTDELYGRGATP